MNQDQQTFLTACPVTRETIHRLTVYQEMLNSWNTRMNLVAESTLPHVWTRHFLDSAQLMPYIPEEATTLADMGSGAGFPGLVLAVLAKEKNNPMEVHAIESTGKKADFLQAVAEALELNVVVRRERVEDIKNFKADVICARALRALPELLKYTNKLIHKDSCCLFLKGKSLIEELTQAKKYWTFSSKTYPSKSDDSGNILVIRNLQYKSKH
ncbi:MAG: 16S rRNA (guanine(527)-N(7))-methyltransferase RsmG [Bdellovibrionales bacterium]|jgi:16S rRNA (guanine527-N7)-methyltransferase